jgi:hypothetical protein
MRKSLEVLLEDYVFDERLFAANVEVWLHRDDSSNDLRKRVLACIANRKALEGTGAACLKGISS